MSSSLSHRDNDLELEEGEMGGIKSGNREEWNGGDGRGQH